MGRFKARRIYLLFILFMSVFLIAGCNEDETGHWNGAVESTPPSVTTVAPLNNAEGVPINIKTITTSFSDSMDGATLTTATFTLVCDGTPVTGGGAVTYLAAGHVATLPLPAATNLPANKECTATVTTGAKNLAGNALVSPYVWAFTTGEAADNALPTVTQTDPADTDIDVAINKKITVTFSEAMAPATLASPAASFTLEETGGDPVSGVVTYLGNIATFDPVADLAPSAEYTATITTVATDLAGNALASAYVWTFTTGGGTDTTKPTVILTDPVDVATGVAVNKKVTATFSESMDPATLVAPATTFRLKEFVNGNSVAGAVAYDAITKMATFTPGSNLANSTKYTATITTTAKDLAGNALAANKVWTFTTGDTTIAMSPELGNLAPFVIASAGGLTNSGATQINGDVVLDPDSTCNAVDVGLGDDFGLCGGEAPTHNAGDLVITQLHPDTTTADAVMATLLAKWNSLTKANLPGATVLGCGTIGDAGGAGAGIGCNGNFTLPPGVYISASNSSIGVSGTLILDAAGDPNAVWVFQAPSSTVTTAPNTIISLVGGAKASNVWWQVGSSATLGVGTEFQGNILASASISMGTGATSCGRLLSGATGAGAFTFLANTVSVPGHPNAPAGCE